MPEPRQPVRGSVKPFDHLSLLSSAKVRLDLDLESSLASQVDGEIDQFNATVRTVAASRMPQDEVDRQLAEARDGAFRKIENILSESQIARLRQLNWQERGTSAISELNLQSGVGISSEELQTILGAAKNRLVETAVNAKQSQDRNHPKWNMDILRRELSSDQLEAVVKLLGPPLKEN